MKDREALIKGNLAKMTGSIEGDMGFCMIEESMGGNAGYYEGMPCVAVNFRFDEHTGEIKYFGNIQDTPSEIVKGFPGGTFRIALNSERIHGSRIIQKMYDLDLEEMSDYARGNIREAVRRYNTRA